MAYFPRVVCIPRRAARARFGLHCTPRGSGGRGASGASYSSSPRRITDNLSRVEPSLVVSLLSLMLSVAALAVSTIYARRNHRLAAGRRKDEREPKSEFTIEPMNSGGWYRMWMTVRSAVEPVDSVSVEILNGAEYHFNAGNDGIPVPESGDRRALIAERKGPFQVGERICWGLEWDRDAARGVLHLRVQHRISADTWVTAFDVDDAPDSRPVHPAFGGR